MPVPVFLGYVKNRDLFLEQQWKYNIYLSRLEGQAIELIVRKRRLPRSNQQNRYLHGVVIPILAEHIGYDVDEMKEALKWRFLRVDNGKNLPTVRSTADLSTAEMTEFIEQVRRLAAEMGCNIPSPGEAE